MSLNREDYTEPRCPFETDQWKSEPVVKSIPVARVMERLDECYSRSDYDGAVSVISYWIEEAKAGGDLRGEFSLRNELMGIYRKTGKKDLAVENAKLALRLAELMDVRGSISEGTALVNAATVYKAFDMPEESIGLFERAKSIYESLLKEGDWRLAGLYNNMALTLADLGRYSESRDLFNKALKELALVPGSEPEQAVTYLNLADVEAAERGPEPAESDISELCLKASELLDTEGLTRDGNYAFYCEKCAPVFSYYGFFVIAEDLAERARRIYERP